MIEDFWNEYCRLHKVRNVRYKTAFQFGSDADELAGLVIVGNKKATSSLYDLYKISECELPQEGEYHIILDSQDSPVAIIRITSVSIIPFNQMEPELTKLEGEGTHAYWISSHERFFSSQVVDLNTEFNHESKIVFEQFECVYSK